MVEGERVQECFRVGDTADDTARDAVGKWFGGVVASVVQGGCLILLDDGDVAERTSDTIKGLVGMGKFAKLEDARGLVAGTWQADRAVTCSSIKVGGAYRPSGVLLGDGMTKLCGKPMYSAHILSLSLLTQALADDQQSKQRRQRPSRGSSGSGDDQRGGLATFRRGDRAISTGTSAIEVVYGVMSFFHSNQQIGRASCRERV